MISVSHSERAQMPVCSWRSEWHFRADIRILCLGRCSSPHPCRDPRNSARVDSVERQRRSSLLRSIIPSIALAIHLPICHSAFTLPSDQGAVPALDPTVCPPRVGPSPRPLLLFSNSFRAAPTLHGVSLNYLYSSTSRCVPFLPSFACFSCSSGQDERQTDSLRPVPYATQSTYPSFDLSSQRVCRTPRSRIPRDP
jgi:hypothetical protein